MKFLTDSLELIPMEIKGWVCKIESTSRHVAWTKVRFTWFSIHLVGRVPTQLNIRKKEYAITILVAAMKSVTLVSCLKIQSKHDYS